MGACNAKGLNNSILNDVLYTCLIFIKKPIIEIKNLIESNFIYCWFVISAKHYPSAMLSRSNAYELEEMKIYVSFLWFKYSIFNFLV